MPLVIEILTVVLFSSVSIFFLYQKFDHVRSLNALEHRILVNGIRGKSSIVTLIHSMFIGADIPAVSRITGTNATMFSPTGEPTPVKRAGNASILELYPFLRWAKKFSPKTVILECMAVRPDYQRALQRKLYRGDIVIISNVRFDHTDVLGETLEEIALSLSETIPYNGYLITAEQDTRCLEIFAYICRQRNTQLIVADAARINPAYLERFPYIQHAENIAIALEVAQLVGINSYVALESMISKAYVDPTNAKTTEFNLEGAPYTWIPLFSVNDPVSTLSIIDDLGDIKNEQPVLVYSHRDDRSDRLQKFTEILLKSELDYSMVFIGNSPKKAEKYFTSQAAQCGKDIHTTHVLTPKESSQEIETEQILLHNVVDKVPGDNRQNVLIGIGNIHSRGAHDLQQEITRNTPELVAA